MENKYRKYAGKKYMIGKNGKVWVNEANLSQRETFIGDIRFGRGDAVGTDEDGNLYNISAMPRDYKPKPQKMWSLR